MPQPAPSAPPNPASASKPKLPGLAGIWIGVILMVVGIVGGIALVVSGARSFVDDLGDLQRVPIDGGGSILIEETGTQEVYAERLSPFGGNSGFQTGTFTGYGPDVYLEVTGPNGSVYFDSNPGGQTYDLDGKQGVLLGKFDAEVTGEYRIETFPGDDVAPYTTIAVGQVFDVSNLAGILGGVFGGGLVFLLGLVVLIVSAVRRSRARKRLQASYDPYGGGYGGTPGWVPPPVAGAAAGGPPAPAAPWSPPGAPATPWTPPGTAPPAPAPTPWSPPGAGPAGPPPPTGAGWAAPPVVAPAPGWQPAPPPAAPAPGAPAPWNPAGTPVPPEAAPASPSSDPVASTWSPVGDHPAPADAGPAEAPPTDPDGPVDPLR